jgi:hypothetical protein
MVKSEEQNFTICATEWAKLPGLKKSYKLKTPHCGDFYLPSIILFVYTILQGFASFEKWAFSSWNDDF